MHGILIAALTVSVFIALLMSGSQFTRVERVRGDSNVTTYDAATGRTWPRRCRGCGGHADTDASPRHGMVLCEQCTIPRGA